MVELEKYVRDAVRAHGDLVEAHIRAELARLQVPEAEALGRVRLLYRAPTTVTEPGRLTYSVPEVLTVEEWHARFPDAGPCPPGNCRLCDDEPVVPSEEPKPVRPEGGGEEDPPRYGFRACGVKNPHDDFPCTAARGHRGNHWNNLSHTWSDEQALPALDEAIADFQDKGPQPMVAQAPAGLEQLPAGPVDPQEIGRSMLALALEGRDRAVEVGDTVSRLCHGSGSFVPEPHRGETTCASCGRVVDIGDDGRTQGHRRGDAPDPAAGPRSHARGS